MHLVAPLVSGIAGCGDGSARIVKRGSTTLATLYSSFEGDPFSSEQLNQDDNVLLDAYGRAEVYVDEVCDVEVLDIDGVQQIVFTAGFSAGGIEVRSPAFTGDSYDGSLGSNQPGLPTTLQEVLDLWLTNRKQVDWGIGIQQPLFVVTDPAYGATGDAITDDTAAVQAAITAASVAGGGIVYFPAGSYRITSTLQADFVTLLGCGSELVFSGAVNPGIRAHGATLVDLHLTGSASGTIVQATTGGAVFVEKCVTVGSGIHYDFADTDLTLGDCELRAMGSMRLIAFLNFMNGHTLYARHCTFQPSSSYTPGGAMVHGSNMHFSECIFDGTPATAGVFDYVRFVGTSDEIRGTVRGCRFKTASGATSLVAISLGSYAANSRFFESDNAFDEGVSRYNYTASASPTAVVQLRTRDLAVQRITDNNATIPILTDQYGTIIVSSTNAAALLTGTLPPRGARGTVIFYHPSGGAGTAQPTTNFFGGAAATTANTSTHAWEYVCAVANTALRMLVTVDAKALGTGAP